jgi:hypothetical protein
MTRALTLSLAGLTVVCQSFKDFKFPRVHGDKAKSNRSSYGAFINYGLSYEAHIWEFVVSLPESQWQILEAIYKEQVYRIDAELNPDILLVDTLMPIVERLPRTRAVAPAPLNIITTFGSNYAKFYAQFYAQIEVAPEIVDFGVDKATGEYRYHISLAMAESDGRVAP